ncbi:prophage regulatory protein [Sphingomonas sp. F9_3S_D5_B_2]
MQKLLRLPEVIQLTNLRRSTIYDLMGKGEFPRPLKITGARLNAWSMDEIETYVAARAADRLGS